MNRNSNPPLVSVIIPTYNRQEYLRECLNSIINQTYKKLEIIIVDNYSDYDISHFAQEFNDSRIKTYLLKKNNSLGIIAANRNFGIQNSNGQYIAFCDDDDLWYPDKIKVQIDVMQQKLYGLCFTNFVCIDRNSQEYSKRPLIKFYHKNLTFNKFVLSNGCICNSSVMIRREVVNTVGLFDEDVNLMYYEDYNYWARILSKFPSIRIENRLVKYRINEERERRTPKEEKYFKELYVLDSLLKIWQSHKIIFTIKKIKLQLQHSFH